MLLRGEKQSRTFLIFAPFNPGASPRSLRLRGGILRSAMPEALSLFVIGHHNMRLAAFSLLIHFGSMKTQKSIHSSSHRAILLMVPVICSMAFASCSDVAGTPGTHQAVNLQSAVVGHAETGDNVTIGPRTYNSEARSFDRPWPFGPESGPQ